MGGTSIGKSLISGFLKSVQTFPSRPAIEVEGESLTYREVGQRAARLADAISRNDRAGRPLVAILAHRSSLAYVAVLAVLASGRGYVPLSPTHPPERIRRGLELAGTDLLILGREGVPALESLLGRVETALGVLLPGAAGPGELPARFPRHRFIPVPDAHGSTDLPPRPRVSPESIAYLLFTSGSSGTPKGVPVTHANARAYVEAVSERYDLSEEDRVSQTFDLAFDLSVHDMFVAWERGACLASVPDRVRFAPARFIKTRALTVWFSVPSVAALMLRMRMLMPGAFPSLRYSLFCGEPLPARCAVAWQRAAPASVVENLYGPTETTIATTAYRWDPATSPEECVNGIVPIGWPLPGQRCRIVDEERRDVADGLPGELCLAGSQVAPGYWNDPGETAARFITLPGPDAQRWFRTGDRVWRDARGCLRFGGRLDNQVKVRGHRVELDEVDAAIRQACGAAQVATVAWPVRDGSAEGVVAFVAGASPRAETAILAACREILPDHMVPTRILFPRELPLNLNGKIDRRQLVESLRRDAE